MDIRPENSATNRPITIVMGPEARMARVVPLENNGALPFLVALEPSSGERTGQFTVSLPGHYRIEAAGETREIYVPKQENLSFAAEFGLFFVVVILSVARMLIWLRRTKKQTASAAGRS